MSLETCFKALAENSLGVILAIIIAYMFYKVLMHILKQQSEIMVLATKQNEHWQQAILEHTASARAFHEEVKEAHKFQREEHKEMISSLGRINGYRKP